MNSPAPARIALVLLLGSIAAPVAAQPPPEEDFPSLPIKKLPGGGKKAVFDVIVEGTGWAKRTVNGSVNNLVCEVTSNTATSEKYEYGRGKGLRVVVRQFNRGGPLLFLRPGRRAAGAQFVVVGEYTDSATGGGSRRPLQSNACPAATDTAGSEEGCGRHVRERTVIGLFPESGAITIKATDQQIPGLLGTECGRSPLETASGPPLWGWPAFPDMKPQLLPPERVFGKRRAFKVKLDSGPLRKDDLGSQLPGDLKVVDTGRHRAIVRFVRVSD